MGRLDGKVAIVAGGSRGIGKGIALAYAREGARVAVVARSETDGRFPGTIGSTAQEIRDTGGTALPVRCDITSEADLDAMVQAVLRRFGAIDVLVNSAVLILYEKTLETSAQQWDAIFAVNVKGAFLLTKAVMPTMMAQRRGSIIHLTGQGAVDPTLTATSTGSTKAALERFVKGMALEAKEYNIAVNCLDPGGVKTERAVALRPPDTDWTRFARPADVGPLAVYLATQDASTLTGQVVRRVEFEGRKE